jgi:hypothetical protein
MLAMLSGGMSPMFWSNKLLLSSQSNSKSIKIPARKQPPFLGQRSKPKKEEITHEHILICEMNLICDVLK